jgi:DNA invertase Pin-like site-specific DNA recombinase
MADMMNGKARPERMDGYVRVSRRMGREGPGYISPDVQREAIERWAAYRNIEIVTWHFDEDESGGTQKRPGLQACMARIEGGETHGLACWRLNRFARNVGDALDDVERIRAAGGALACVEEDIDPTGPFGEFILTILLAVAALELNNIKASWQTAKARAVERGAIIGPTPFGYERQDDGTLLPHPAEAPIVTRAFELAASSGGHAALAYLQEHAPERTWTMFTMRRFLANHSYLGEFAYGELKHRDADLALTDRATWTAAQQRPEGPKRRKAEDFPLSGLATCGTCGEPMVGGRSSGRRHADGSRDAPRMYRCRASLRAWKGERCPKTTLVKADALETFVRDQLSAVISEWEARLDEGDELAPLAEVLEAAEEELHEFAADLTMRRALGDDYPAHRDTRIKAVEEAREAYAHASRTTVSRRIAATETDPAANLDGLARSMLANIVVMPGRGHLPERVTLNPL